MLKNSKGFAHLLVLLLAFGLVTFLVVSSKGPFKNGFFNNFFPITKSQASSTINKKVLLVIYDPILSSGQRLHQARGWNDSKIQNQQFIDAISQSSGGYVNYQVVETKELNEWPRKLDGFRYTETTYNKCMNSGNRVVDCHSPDDADYGQMWSDLGIANKVSSGQVDTVFIWSFPYSGFDEFAYKIPNDYAPYTMPTNCSLYLCRVKNIPNTNGKTVLAMGFSYEVGVDNALHSYNHWVESVMSLTVGRGDWRLCNGTSDWDKYTCPNLEITGSTPIQQAGCGTVHVPFNGAGGYDYANRTVKSNTCSSWANYPFTTPVVSNEDCSAWGCTQLGYQKWWLSHLPKQDGLTTQGNLRNWWKYVADYDNAIAEIASTFPFSKRVFITSTKYATNPNGVGIGQDVADTQCQSTAQAASLGGVWKAWLSYEGSSASSRISHSTIPYTGLDGLKIANNWNDLTDGSIQNPIIRDEFKNLVTNEKVWTGTKQNGDVYSASTCYNWNSKSGSGRYGIASTSYLDGRWTNFNSQSCQPSSTARLYCFEQ